MASIQVKDEAMLMQYHGRLDLLQVVWVRDGHLVRLTGVVSISDGSQNLDVIVVDPLNRTLTADVYGLSN